MKKINWNVIITIMISIVGIYISWKANQIYILQAEIARSTSLPNIHIDEKQVLNSDFGNYTDTVIEISNLEGKLNNYHSEVITVLQCQYLDANCIFYNIEVPINNYYIVTTHSGNSEGIIETKWTTNNYEKIRNLDNEVLKFNDEGIETLIFTVKSYIKISFLDILNEEKDLYYISDIFTTQLMDNQEGEEKFNLFRNLERHNLGLNPNTTEKISVNDLIENIHNISLMDEDILSDNAMRNIEGETWNMNEIVAAILGAVLAYVFGFYQERKNERRNREHSASLLYYDLKSIENYLLEKNSLVNIRYSSDWQRMLSLCAFSNDEFIMYIYKIYDEVYNYNEAFSRKSVNKESFVKEDIVSYKILKELLWRSSANSSSEYNDEYKRVLDALAKAKAK